MHLLYGSASARAFDPGQHPGLTVAADFGHQGQHKHYNTNAGSHGKCHAAISNGQVGTAAAGQANDQSSDNSCEQADSEREQSQQEGDQEHAHGNANDARRALGREGHSMIISQAGVPRLALIPGS